MDAMRNNRTGLRVMLFVIILGTLPLYILGAGLWLFAPNKETDAEITDEADFTMTPLGANVTRTTTPTLTVTLIRTATQSSNLVPTPGQFIPPARTATLPPTRLAPSTDTPAPTLTRDIRDDDQDGILNVNDQCPNDSGPVSNNGCPVDSDNDGVNDNIDQCPQQSGPSSNNGCPLPPADSDADGIPDTSDQCPNQAGSAAYNGCPPPDTDGDGIIDPNDQCPTQAGLPLLNGCPDGDGDGVPDGVDTCPTEAGLASNNGCPAPAAPPAEPPAGSSLPHMSEVVIQQPAALTS